MGSGTGAQLAMLPWFVRDYIAATRHLSLAERGAYTDLLFLSWEMGPLPADPARLARLVGCGADEFSQIWPGIRDKFTEAGECSLVNARLEEHRAESRRRSQTAREKAEKRWHADNLGLFDNATAHAAADATAHAAADATALAGHMPGACYPSPSPSPSPQSPSGTTLSGVELRKRAHKAAKHLQPQLVDVYHELLPELPKVKMAWSDERQRLLVSAITLAIQSGRPADTIDWWRRFFSAVSASDFLIGRQAGSSFRVPGIDWLLKNTKDKPIFTRIIEGAYENGGARRHGR